MNKSNNFIIKKKIENYLQKYPNTEFTNQMLIKITKIYRNDVCNAINELYKDGILIKRKTTKKDRKNLYMDKSHFIFQYKKVDKNEIAK